MKLKLTANHTVTACFIGSMVQAITINFSPLLFLTFEKSFGISLGKISLLIAISFVTQFFMDLTASKFPKLFNRRGALILGQMLSATGLVSLALLPTLISPYPALVTATVIGAFGSGIIEVIGNPVIEACPVKNKNRILSFLHSCYCWGFLLTVLLSTLFFHFVGIENWQILACLWAIIPFLNGIAFCFVPLWPIDSAPDDNTAGRSVFRTFVFWSFFILMVCGGAAEQAMSQWASSFAETALGVSKSVGDILGPCCFALLMGISRIIYAKFSERINLYKFIFFSAALCIASYLLVALSPLPIMSLAGCAVCGFSVGMMWPGTLCIASEKIPGGGVKMFALLALAGDLGCTLGPSAVGVIADAAGDNLKVSFIVSIIFPALVAVFITLLALNGKNKKKRSI